MPALSRKVALIALLATPLCPAGTQEQVDVLIQGGRLVDGTGAAARGADVAIRGDRIVFVGDAGTRFRAVTVIDARGLIVAPGFIDPHTHAYGDIESASRESRINAAYLMQGVTTVLAGNDGGGPVDIAAHFARWSSRGIGTNAALYVGFGTVRVRVMGTTSKAPLAAQVEQMRALVASAMNEGALGLSTGLYYAPQSYATTEEVIALAKVAGAAGGVYDSHIRDESSYSIGLLGAIREAIRIGREGGLPTHISHIKALGVDVWGQSDSAIAIVRASRASGQQVTANQYPYTASGSSVGASLLPRWAESGGRDSLRVRVTDPAIRARLLADMTDNLRRRGGAKSLLITTSRQAGMVGKTLDQIAVSRGTDAISAALDIVLAGDASVASFNMDEGDIVKFMKQDFVFTGSDGSAGHPRKFGTFPKKMREYVLTKRVLTLEEMVHRSSGAPAAALGIAERGTLASGQFADVIVFDTATVRDRSTYEQPELLAEGMRYVLVNGQVAVKDGKLTDALAGRGLARAPRPLPSSSGPSSRRNDE
jgi:N-acyl-D-aspartate/D-glutamate deacylase